MPLLSSQQPRYSMSAYQAFLVPALLAWVLGVWLAHNQLGMACLPWPWLLTVVLLLLTLAIASNKRWIGQACLWTLALIGGGLYLLWGYPLLHHWLIPNAVQYHLPLYRVQVQGHILNYQTIATDHGLSKVTLAIKRVNGLPLTGCVYIPHLSVTVVSSLPKTKASPPTTVAVGQAVTISGSILPPKEALFTGGYSQRQYLTGLGIEGVLLPDAIDTPTLSFSKHMVTTQQQGSLQPIVEPNPWYWHLLAWAQQCRQRITLLFAKALPSPQAQILGGMVLGDKAIPVDDRTRQQFIRTGLIHLLAASGMNVAVVVGGCLWLGKQLRLPRVANIMVALVALGGYCVLTGLPPSIVRAGSMLTLALLLKAWDKTLSPLLLFSFAVVLVVLLQPTVLLSVGFQFSCLTTVAIIGLLPPLQAVLGYYIGRFLAGLVLVPFVAQLSILPISIYTFNTINLQSIPFNIIALPLTAGLTLLGFVSALCGLFMPWVCHLLTGLAYWPLTGLVTLASWGGQLPQWKIASPTLLGLFLQHLTLLIGALLASGWLLPRWPGRRKVSLVLALLSLLLVSTAKVNSGLQLDWLPLSNRMGAWIIQQPLVETPLVLLPQLPTPNEQLTLNDYLAHQALSVATLWVATQWQADADANTTPAVPVSAVWGQSQLGWKYNAIINNPTVRIETNNGCLQLALGPSPLSLWPVPRFGECGQQNVTHTVLKPHCVHRFWQEGTTLRRASL
jgi:ComEC/Rec2-related protein